MPLDLNVSHFFLGYTVFLWCVRCRLLRGTMFKQILVVPEFMDVLQLHGKLMVVG